jgi:hypothetical protein
MDLFKPSVKDKASLTSHFYDTLREEGESCSDDVEENHECTGCDEKNVGNNQLVLPKTKLHGWIKSNETQFGTKK